MLAIAGFVMACEPANKEDTSSEKPEVSESETRHSLKMDMLGEWRNIAMKVKIDNGDEQDSIVDVPAGKWEEVLSIKPIRTTFDVNDTYTSEYRDHDDMVIMTRTGTWSVKGDTLIMSEEGSTYTTKISGNVAEFEGYMDWDEDGEEDDYYWGKQQKQ